MSWVTNLMVHADAQDRDIVETFSDWLRDAAPCRKEAQGHGVGFLRLITGTPDGEAWGGWKYPEGFLWAGALNHADLSAVLQHVAAATWRRPELVQIFLKDQDEPYFRLYMFRDGRWQQLAPPA